MKMTMEFEREIEAGELAQRLAHQAGLQAGLHVAHLALDLGLRRQRRDRIDDEHVDRARADQRVGDLERLLAGVGLRDQEIVEVDAELAGIDRDRARARRRRRRRRRPSSAPRRRGAARASSCPRIPGRRSRSTRPRGRPPTPSAMSRPSEPVDIVSISTGFWSLPSRMIEPLPNARSICASAASRAFVLSMDEPSTRRSAAWDMRGGPYGRRGGRTQRARPDFRTPFVLVRQCGGDPASTPASGRARKILRPVRPPSPASPPRPAA